MSLFNRHNATDISSQPDIIVKAKKIGNFLQQWKLYCCHFILKKINRAEFKRHKKIIIGFGLVIFISVLGTLLFILLNKPSPASGPSPATNLIQINSIQSDLHKIQNTVSATHQMTVGQKQALDGRLQSINEKVKSLSTHNDSQQLKQIQQLQVTLHSNTLNLSQKITTLNQELEKIKSKVFPKSILTDTALPFKVVSVDSWNGEPYAEVVQRNNATMTAYVSLYQHMAGWKVTDISAIQQSVTFTNAEGQVVHVRIKTF